MFPLEHFDLCGSECRRRRQLLLKHSSIKALHQLGSRGIINLPKAGNDSGRSRIHKASHETHQAFAPDFFSEAGLTGTQDNETRVEVQVVNLV